MSESSLRELKLDQPEDPRRVPQKGDKWITDTRIYNIVWLGRWLERAENIGRALDSAALLSTGKPEESFREALSSLASSWGLGSREPLEALNQLVWENPTSSIKACLQKARENASQVAPLELMQSINATLATLDRETEDGRILTPERLHALVTDVLADLKKTFQAIEVTWFKRESLGEEEIVKRFVQQ